MGMREVLVCDYNTIIWDFDGCLVNTLGPWEHAVRNVLAFESIYPDMEAVKDIMSNLGKASLYGYQDSDEFVRRVLDLMHSVIDQIQPYDRALETLSELTYLGVSHAIVTSATREWVFPIMRRLGFDEFINVVAYRGHEEIKTTKPNPEPLLWALKKLNRIREGAVIIGDSKVDFEAGIEAGVTPFVAYYEPNERYLAEDRVVSWGAKHIITSFAQLIAIVRGRG